MQSLSIHKAYNQTPLPARPAQQLSIQKSLQLLCPPLPTHQLPHTNDDVPITKGIIHFANPILFIELLFPIFFPIEFPFLFTQFDFGIFCCKALHNFLNPNLVCRKSLVFWSRYIPLFIWSNFHSTGPTKVNDLEERQTNAVYPQKKPRSIDRHTRQPLLTNYDLLLEERFPSMNRFNRPQQRFHHIIFRYEALCTGGNSLHNDKNAHVRGNQNHACRNR